VTRIGGNRRVLGGSVLAAITTSRDTVELWLLVGKLYGRVRTGWWTNIGWPFFNGR